MEFLRAYWSPDDPPTAGRVVAWAAGLGLVSALLVLFAFDQIDRPRPSAEAAMLAGALTVAASGWVLRRAWLASTYREYPRWTFFAGAIVGAPVALLLATVLQSALESVGSSGYVTVSFGYWILLAYGVLPLVVVGGAAGGFMLLRDDPARGWGVLAAPWVALATANAVLGAYLVVAAPMLARTAREAYARNTPGAGWVLATAALALALLARRR